MKKNIGNSDRTIRLILGSIIVIVGVVYGSWLGLIGLVPILTALVGWCPLYVPFGISTCRTKAVN